MRRTILFFTALLMFLTSIPAFAQDSSLGSSYQNTFQSSGGLSSYSARDGMGSSYQGISNGGLTSSSNDSFQDSSQSAPGLSLGGSSEGYARSGEVRSYQDTALDGPGLSKGGLSSANTGN